MTYHRTYLLLPPRANLDWFIAAGQGSWDKHRYTVGGSADDASIPATDLASQTVILVNPNAWEGNIIAYLRSRSPSIKIRSINANSPDHLRTLLAQPSSPPVVGYPLRGGHDLGFADLLLSKGLKGWCTEAVYLDGGPRNLNLQKYAEEDIRVLLRLNWSYAYSDGGKGTLPSSEEDIARFVSDAVETIERNAAWGYIICNEMNSPRESPNARSISENFFIDVYNRIEAEISTSYRLSPGAIDPTNAGWSDWRFSWPFVLNSLARMDFLSLHAYCHGSDLNLIRGTRTFKTGTILAGVFYDLRMLESQQAVIPRPLRTLPQIVTETNHLYRRDGRNGWDEDIAGEWIIKAFEYFREHGIAGVCPFRYNYNEWAFKDIPSVLRAMQI